MAQAITLGHSLKKFNPDYRFVICLVDRKIATVDYDKIPFEILEVERIGVPYFEEMIFRYDIVELNTAFKPYYFQHFFNRSEAETVIYLDPDIEVFAPFIELEKELQVNDIIITPHFTTPLNDDKWQAEEDFLNSGLYNLGFIAIKNSSIGQKMVNWWVEKMRNKAYIDFNRGLFTDQIWINFVPLFFSNVKIFTNVGYNVAYWNLHERTLFYKNGVYYVNEIQPLVFYHYASFRPLNPDIISTGQRRFTFEQRPDIAPLFRNYCELLFQNNYKDFVTHTCYFVENKERLEKHQLQDKISKIPFYKKAIGKILREIIKRLGLVMDYNTLK
jgi:hypothetical protein